MSRSADVKSVEAIKRFRLELQKYQKTLRQALDHLRTELQRGQDWLESDRVTYWRNQGRVASNQLSEAIAALEVCMVSKVEGQARACDDERAAVARCKARINFADQQSRVTKHWIRHVQHESDEFSAHLTRLDGYVEQDLTNAIAMLHRIETSLDKYTEQSTPQNPDSSAS